MPSMADVIAAQAGGGPVYEGSDDPGVTSADILGLLGGYKSWADQAKQQYGKDVAAYQSGGVPALMADTQFGQDVGGAFAGLIGGRGSRTADLGKLAKAEQMAAKGASPAEIYQEARWFQGPEGLWRYEIPDRGSGFKASAEDLGWLPGSKYSRVPPRPLAQVYEHPELYEAYPKTGNYTMYWGQPASTPEGFVVRGGIDPEKGIVFLNNQAIPKRGDQRSALLHELQHGLQYEEGFARGGSPEHPLVRQAADAYRVKEREQWQGGLDAIYGARDRYVAAQQVNRPNADRLELVKEFWSKNPDAVGATAEIHRALQMLDRPGVPADISNKFYRSLGGEVEARNVQERRNYGQKRLATPPFATQDTPFAEQLLRLGD